MVQEQKYVMGYFYEQNFKVQSKVLKFALRFTTPNLGCKQIVCCNFNSFFFAKIGFLHLFFV